MVDNQQPSSQRKCKSCGATKPLDEFAIVYAKNSRGQNYRQHTCIVCARAKSADKERRLRAANPQKYRDALKRWRDRTLPERKAVRKSRYEKIKKQVFDHYGWACACCGETCASMLNVDHKNNDGGEFRRSIKGMRWSYNFYEWIINNDFPDDLQTLCYNCNMSKHRNGGVCEHQLREGSTTRAKARRAKRPEVQSTRPHIG